LLLLGASGCALSGAAQVPAAGPGAIAAPAPTYDVSTVKTNNTGSGSIRVSTTDDMMQATNVKVGQLLEIAFDIRQDQILNLPHWADVNHYDIMAKVVDMTPEQRKGLTREQRMATIQKLLKERFHVESHVETRTLPLLNLVVAKDGVKFDEWKKPAEGEKDNSGSMNVNNSDMVATGVPMRSFTMFLSGQTHMPVVDKTGLAGKYNLHLKFSREEEGPQSGLRDDTVPTIYSALTEQLGLKLESAKGPVEVLVIDKIEQPEEN
jgi:uncharacterized protein (TIGR03435 family)